MTYYELKDKLLEDYKSCWAGNYVIDYWEFDRWHILISYNMSDSSIDKDVYNSALAMCESIFEELTVEDYYESGTQKEYARLLDKWHKDYELVYCDDDEEYEEI